MLILKNNRPDFKSLFNAHLNKVRLSYSSYNPYCCGYDDCEYDDGYLFGDYDDDFYYDGLMHDYHNCFGASGYHKRKRGNRGGSRKKRSKYVPLSSYDDDIYPSKYGKKSKRNSSSKNARYSDKESDLFSSLDDDKLIYYYSDMNNPDDNVTIFYSVFDFDKFLEEEGVYVNESDIQSLLNRSVSHCCINPFVDGRLELMTDSSFGGLHYQYAENNDDLLAAEDKLVHSSRINN